MTNAHSKAMEALKSEYEKIAKDRDGELEDVLSSNNERHAAEIAKMRAEQTQAVANLLSAHDLDKQHMEATYQADMIALDESRAEIRRLKESLRINLDDDEEEEEDKKKKKMLLKIKKQPPA